MGRAEIDRERRELLEQVRRKYRTRSDPLTVGPLRLEFVRCADPDAVLDEVASEADARERSTGERDPSGDTLHLPYWAELWDSSYVVGAMLAGSPALDGVRVLDVGCGMGLTAAAAAFAGASVVAVDLELPALLFTRLNTWPWRQRVTVRQINWQTDVLGERFPLIVGADILYERAQWPHLDLFFRNHLTDGGRVLLGEPGRQTGDAFVPWARAMGWQVDVTLHPTPTRRVPVRVIELRRPSADAES